MKKLLTTILIILFISTGAWAGQGWVKQSTQGGVSAAITTSEGLFAGILVTRPDSGYISIALYDNATAASGTKLIPTIIVYSANTTYYRGFELIKPPGLVRYYNGIYASITTTTGNATWMIYFETDK